MNKARRGALQNGMRQKRLFCLIRENPIVFRVFCFPAAPVEALVGGGVFEPPRFRLTAKIEKFAICFFAPAASATGGGRKHPLSEKR